jgi:NADP-dependent aldehyde dehydrogenase
MKLNGTSIIGYGRSTETGSTFHAVNPATGEKLETAFHKALPDEVDHACKLAECAFVAYRRSPAEKRSTFLRAIADEIEALGDDLLQRYTEESGLPMGRAQGERGRTCGQLRLFADHISQPGWDRSEVEAAQPERAPLPKPATELRYIGIGPVVVFGPSNFPLAFDVAGGDTASALAAGCPVVVKAHSSHPGTSELVGLAIVKAAQSCGMPEGVFSLIFGDGRVAGTALVQHPSIKAVGFTGSEGAGRALFNLAVARPEPIPVFAEMSSINPVLLFSDKLAEDPDGLATGLCGSVTLGVGQFCTNPGLILVSKSAASKQFLETLASKLQAVQPAPMLDEGVKASYVDGLQRLAGSASVDEILAAKDMTGCGAVPALYRISADAFLGDTNLWEEVFGPVTLIVECESDGQFLEILYKLGGQLTISFFATDSDVGANADTLKMLETKAGRIICNGWPTGVEVCATMVHGGPYPATTDGRFTSVGLRAIDRFLRPVCFQDLTNAAQQLMK